MTIPAYTYLGIIFLRPIPTSLQTVSNIILKCSLPYEHKLRLWSSVTRSGDFLDFGQLFNAFGNN